jgi:hypothetical protein
MTCVDGRRSKLETAPGPRNVEVISPTRTSPTARLNHRDERIQLTRWS